MNRELIDFLSPKLSEKCEISSDGVSDDYYSLDNLIATDVAKRNVGFMAFAVSKPPIEILLRFPWKINLKMIRINSVLSSLKSTKFQVFIQCTNFDGSEVFRKIGDVLLNEDQIGFILKTDDFVHSLVDPTLKAAVVYPFTKRNMQSLQVIKIVIQDTVLKRAPVIKKIEVWGYPSFQNSKEDNGLILKNWLGTSETEENQATAVEETPAISQPFHIPEEFLDSITNELLVMPFILPSGNVIDETTMQKHNRHEEVYGRLPSDPFTGLIYSSDHQPKFHEVLKCKLDEFKLRNNHETEIKWDSKWEIKADERWERCNLLHQRANFTTAMVTSVKRLSSAIARHQISTRLSPPSTRTTKSRSSLSPLHNRKPSNVESVHQTKHRRFIESATATISSARHVF